MVHGVATRRGPVSKRKAPTSRSPGRPPVEPERFIDTALAIVDANGAEALSMRTLAQQLGSGTATLYRHFADRAELVSQVVDRVLAEAVRDVGDLEGHPWDEACRKHATAVFNALRRHRHVASLLVDHVPTGPSAMALREAGVSALLANGFPPRLAARSYTTLAHYVVGFAIQAGSKDTDTGDGDQPPPERLRSAANRSHFPATTSVITSLTVSIEEEFTFGLGLILLGLAEFRKRERRAQSKRG